MHNAAPFDFAGHAMMADASGGLYWAGQSTLVVSDLHLEKGSSFAARRHRHLPPYDTRATLTCLSILVARYDPARVVCLGDSFHDLAAFDRMDEDDCTMLSTLAKGREWIWITGNHDPLPNGCFGGRTEDEIEIAGIVFRHQAGRTDAFEVSGHYHPKAAIVVRNSRVAGRCFAIDGARLIMPAFGAYTGGLNVLDPAIRDLMDDDFHVAIIGRERIVRMPRHKLVA